MAEIGKRAPAGVAMSGFEYQHLVALNEVLAVIRHPDGVASITIEARDVGNVDDIVVKRDAGRSRYVQAKHTVDGSTPVGTDYLLEEGRSGSLLQRFHRSWRDLTSDAGEPELCLVTDRELDPSDALMAGIDRSTELLVPDAMRHGPRSERGKARKVWADHLGVPEDELFEFLGCLRFETGRAELVQRQLAGARLDALGLSSTDDDVRRAIGVIREWTMGRDRELAPTQAGDLIYDALPTAFQRPDGVLVIQTVDSIVADDTDACIDLRHLIAPAADFNGRLEDPDAWNAVVLPELVAATDALRAEGRRRILVRGPARQSLLFLAGAALADVRGFELVYEHRGMVWDSAGAAVAAEVNVAEQRVGDGGDVAVVAAVAVDATADVVTFVGGSVPSVGKVVTVAPPAGPSRAAIPTSSVGKSFAERLRNVVQAERTDGRIHLFLAGPGGLALLAGTLWNRCPQTIVYEHEIGARYFPTATVDAIPS